VKIENVMFILRNGVVDDDLSEREEGYLQTAIKNMIGTKVTDNRYTPAPEESGCYLHAVKGFNIYFEYTVDLRHAIIFRITRSIEEL